MIATLGHVVGDALGRSSAPMRVLQSAYGWCLAKAYTERGLPWHVNGEPFRIDPRVRHFLPHENEPALFDFLRAHLRPGDHVLDIGAFLGTYAVLSARRVGPAGKVIAVEPSPTTFAILRRHLEMNGCRPPQVDARRAAVGGETGQTTLLVFDEEPYRNMVAPEPADGMPVDRVTVETLCETWGRPPDWIRMDVQGQEFEVLRGAREVLREGRTRLVVEMHPEQWPDYGITSRDVPDLLAAHGLRARPVVPGTDAFGQGAHALLEARP